MWKISEVLSIFRKLLTIHVTKKTTKTVAIVVTHYIKRVTHIESQARMKNGGVLPIYYLMTKHGALFKGPML